MVGAILRLRGSQKDMVVEKETEHKLKFFSFQYDKYPWLCGLMIVYILLGYYTIFLNSYSSLINHIILYSQTNQIRSTLGFGFSGNLVGYLYFEDVYAIRNIPDYISKAMGADLRYLLFQLLMTISGYNAARFKLFTCRLLCDSVRLKKCMQTALLSLVCGWLFLDSAYSLGLLQQAVFYTIKYKLNVNILGMHPILAILVLAVATVIGFYISFQVLNECTSDKEKKTENKSGKISNKFKEMSENNDPVLPIFVLAVATASAFYVSVQESGYDGRKSKPGKISNMFKKTAAPQVICSKFLRFCSRVYLILLGLTVLAFSIYIQVGVILLRADPAYLPSVTYNNESYPTMNGVTFYVKEDLDLKHEHVALPINLGFNLPMEFYSLNFNSSCTDCEEFILSQSYSSTSLMVVQATIWGLAATKLLLNTICCGSHTQSNLFRILLWSSLLHFYTILRQSWSMVRFCGNSGLSILIVLSAAGFVINLVILVLFQISSRRLYTSSNNPKTALVLPF
ncbi:uncharacterized protein LOC111710360 isoform X2 [Eurytemora carolleeae]|uniref:uncharacterized protein LOC111710360 isoform X2 n=1 Tax=Eurytemora carolleeae TaxID=1294199 RepID=UPI000C776A3F|nr:uncharacterized protein LOC111710360 isoform X2 [Eurytemora carolleeae]|eukprot:XP_023340194.1 uncharacterized protein LOC111710360 isoform X2 [Eurytemora affinis]